MWVRVCMLVYACLVYVYQNACSVGFLGLTDSSRCVFVECRVLLCRSIEFCAGVCRLLLPFHRILCWCLFMLLERAICCRSTESCAGACSCSWSVRSAAVPQNLVLVLVHALGACEEAYLNDSSLQRSWAIAR